MSIKTLTQAVLAGAKEHKPEIMIGTGIIIGVGAIFVAIKETPACLAAIDKAEAEAPVIIEVNEENEEVEVPVGIDWKTKGLIFGKYYWKVLILEAASVVLIVWGSKIRLDKFTALAAIYGVTKSELDDLKKVIAAHPENWQKKFAEKKAEIHVDNSDPKDVPKEKMSNTDVPMPLPLFWDDQAKVYFRMSEEDLRDAVAEFTNEIVTDPFQATSMNDWMRILDHEPVVNGDYYLMTLNDPDWDGALKYRQIGVKEAPTKEPCRMMSFSKEYHLDARGLYCDN